MSRVIKLLLLIPTLDRSGAEKQLTLLATGLSRPEFDVRVVVLTRAGPFVTELNAHSIPVTVIGKRFKCDPVALWRLRRLLREEPPDVLHTWLFAANTYGRFAAGSHPPYPIVVSERCVDSWKSGWQLHLDNLLMRRTTRLVGNSQPVAEFYRAHGFPTDRIDVIRNGIDVPDLIPEARSQILRELEIPEESRVVGYVGRLAPQKRVMDLIWAFELIKVMHQDAVFLIVGDGPERTRLEAFSRGLEHGRRVRFLGHRDDALRLFPAMDVFWLASDFEGMSNSVMEAMAAGLPVVASNIAPNRELVVHGETGYIVPTGDRIAFTQFARKLLFEPDLARRMGAAGRGRIESEFSVPRMVQAYAKLYRDVVGNQPRLPPVNS